MNIHKIIITGAKQAKKEIEKNIEFGQKRNLGWEPFSERTIEYKKEHNNPYFGLIDTGEMFGSVEIIDYKENEEEAEIIVKVDDWKAKLHEYGFVNEHGFKVPPRPFISPIYDKKEQRDEIISAMIIEFKKQLKEEKNRLKLKLEKKFKI